MFCTSLRQRSHMLPLIPLLTVSPLSLRESQLTTHDLELKLGALADPKTRNTPSTQSLRIMLLSPPDIEEAALEGTMQRIRRFAALTGGQDIAIILILSAHDGSSFGSAKYVMTNAAAASPSADGITAYAKLQAEMFNHAEMPYVPILPLHKADGLQALLSRYVETLNRPAVQPVKPATSSFELLRLCTVNPPMSQQTAYMLSDLFPNLRALAAACSDALSAPATSSSPGAAYATDALGMIDHGTTRELELPVNSSLHRLCELVGEAECQKIIEFWRGDWRAE